MVEDVDETEDEDPDHVNGERYEEHEEVSVVSPSNAVVHPRTVMVEYLNAVVADTAVTTAGRPIELAGDAPLHPHGDPVDLDVPVERRPEIVISVLVWAGSRYDARVHEGRHGEVDQHEDGNNAWEEGYPGLAPFNRSFLCRKPPSYDIKTQRKGNKALSCVFIA